MTFNFQLPVSVYFATTTVFYDVDSVLFDAGSHIRAFSSDGRAIDS